MARLYRQRPSALLGIPDPYVAYCVDEAAAWLLSQKEEPTYGDAPGKGRASKAGFNTAQHLRIVEKHGGTVDLADRPAPGRSTEFLLRLPLDSGTVPGTPASI